MDGRPAVLDDEVIERVRLRLRTPAVRPTTPLAPGQRVIIDRGPLRMVDAIFERTLDRGSRVQILIQLLGRPLTVEVDPNILRAVG
jgi:transcription antitermination factor NusG